jgi:hypothetical protein
MLRELPPYQVQRVVDFIHGVKKTIKEKPEGGKKAKKAAGETPVQTEVKTKIVETGLNRNVPRSMITEVERYLREREADDEWFDSVAVQARKSLKRLYSVLHIKPGKRAQAILFDEKPPEGSKALAIKVLAKATTPAEQAKAVLEHKIPFRVASTLMPTMTPTVLLALIEVASPQEVINNLGMLKRHGALNNPDLKKLVEDKLEKAQTGKRVNVMKAQTQAAKAVAGDTGLQEKLEAVTDRQAKAKGRIKRSTAMLVDKSGSMSQALELGKQIGALIGGIMDAPLFVYAFDTMAYPIAAKGDKLADWNRAFEGLTAVGGTSCGIALKHMIRNKEMVENIILITDEGENQVPAFWPTYQEYRNATGLDPAVTIVKVQGAANNLELQAQALKIECSAWQFSGGADYYSLSELIPFLTRPSRTDLLMDIMSWPLPQRKTA